MGKLECRCGAKAEGKTFEEADEKIDHGIAQIKGNSCGGHPSDMTWNGKPIGAFVSKVEKPKESKEPPKEPKESKGNDKSTNSKKSENSKNQKTKKSKGQK